MDLHLPRYAGAEWLMTGGLEQSGVVFGDGIAVEWFDTLSKYLHGIAGGYPLGVNMS